MLGNFLFLFILSFNVSEIKNFRYTFGICPASVIIDIREKKRIIFSSLGMNFEIGVKNNFSLNFTLNSVLIILPVEFGFGFREYLQGRERFQGVYLYQGGKLGWIDKLDIETLTKANYPYLVLGTGYKYIDNQGGFTIDPFLELRIVYVKEREKRPLSWMPFFLFPILGLYLGYSW